MDYDVYIGNYDLGESVQGGFENLTWSEGDDKTEYGFFSVLRTYDVKPGYGNAVYFTGTFVEGRNWSKAVRGEYHEICWVCNFTSPDDDEAVYYKTLTGPYDLGPEVEYTFPGLTRQNR